MIVSGAVLFKNVGGSNRYFVVQDPSSGRWELVKLVVRKGESSVRAIIRLLGEKGGMSVRVVDEAGRFKNIATSNNKTVTQNNIFYVILFKLGSADAFGFERGLWLEYSKAHQKLSDSNEKEMLKMGHIIARKWMERRKKQTSQASQ